MKIYISKVLSNKMVMRLLLFSAFFFFYVLLGGCIIDSAPYGNCFFGADNGRVFIDLSQVQADHGRVKVHPLFILLVQPFSLLLSPQFVWYGVRYGVVMIQSLSGAMSVLVFNMILENLKIEKKLCILMTLIFGFSFTNMIFSTVPETFIFAQIGLIVFWFYISSVSEFSYKLKKVEIFNLIFLGIICFGITITNYLWYLVGLTYLLFKRGRNIKYNVKIFTGINFVNCLGIIVLCKIQSFIWKGAPPFWNSIFDSLFHNIPYEETNYMNWSISFSKMILWIKQTLLYPLLCPDVYLIPEGNEYRPILFGKYPDIIAIFFFLFMATVVIGIMSYIVKLIIKRYKDLFFASVFLVWIGNMCLHYIYGAEEAFIYSSHYYFFFLLLVGYTFNTVESQIVRKCLRVDLIACVVIEFINNLWRFFQTFNLAMERIDMPYSFVQESLRFLVKFIAVMIIVLLSLAGLIVYFSNRREQNRKQLLFEKDNTGKRACACVSERDRISVIICGCACGYIVLLSLMAGYICYTAV